MDAREKARKVEKIYLWKEGKGERGRTWEVLIEDWTKNKEWREVRGEGRVKKRK